MNWVRTSFRAIENYFSGAYKEFQAVTWPTRESIVRYTILVTLTIVVSVLLLTALDHELQQLANYYLVR